MRNFFAKLVDLFRGWNGRSTKANVQSVCNIVRGGEPEAYEEV